MENISIEQIFEFANKLDAIAEIKAKRLIEDRKTDPYESEDTKEINTALSSAQGEFNSVTFNRNNPYLGLGYSDLDEILKVVKPSLMKQGLSVTQQETLSQDGSVTLVTKLRHTSGQFIETRARVIPPKNDIKTYESILNAHKKLSAMSLLGITITNDPADDDGEGAMLEAGERLAKGPSQKNSYIAKDQSFEAITKEQLEELHYELEGFPQLAEEIMDRMHLRSLADMPKNTFLGSIRKIREIKTELGKMKK